MNKSCYRSPTQRSLDLVAVRQSQPLFLQVSVSVPRLPGLQQGPWRTSRDSAAAGAAISAIENILRGGSREQVADTATEAMAGLGLGGEHRDLGAAE